MKQQRHHLLFALLLGVSLTLGYAPWSLWYAVPFVLAAFLVLLNTSKRPGHQLGFCFGFGWFGAGISWVHVSIEQFGGLPLVGSLSLMGLLCAYLAIYPTLAFALLKRYVIWQRWWYALPVIWFVTEWLRSWVLTGFPWLSLGYTQTQGLLASWAPLIGETGLSMLLMLSAALLAHFAQQQKPRLRLCLVVASLAVSSLFVQQIAWVHPTNTHYRIAMVQGNIKQDLRWAPEQDAPTMRKYLELSEPHWNADIIIWPEAAIPRIEPLSQHFLKGVDEQAIATRTGFITGIVNYNFESQHAYNSLIALGVDDPATMRPTNPPNPPISLLENAWSQADSALPTTGLTNNIEIPQPPTLRPSKSRGHYEYQHSNRYSKHHLLPIGEFIPLENWIRGLAPIFDLPMSSFSRGDYQQTNLQVNGARFVPAICFEIAFPNQIRANLQPHSNFIITVSNDAWFGHSHGPHQHLEIAQMRAKELGIPVLRATNNGISAFINSDGSITAQAPQFEEATIEQTVYTYKGNTPYRYLGEFPHWLLVLMVGLLLTKQYRSSRHPA